MRDSSAIDRATAEVVSALEDRGVEGVLLKGPAIARWLYEDPSERAYGDIDLLIAPSALADAERLLGSLAFRGELFEGERGRPPARIWTREADAVAVELHTTVPGSTADGERAWSLLAAQTERLEVGGRPVPVLPAPARALVVGLAAAEKGTHAAKPVRDLGAALERVPEEQWREAASLAADLGVSAELAAGLRLDPRGAALAAALDLPADAAPVTILRAETSPDVRGAAPSMAWIAEQPGLRGRTRALVQVLLPTPSSMRGSYPLARRGRFGLAAAYLWRLVISVPKLAPATRAYIAARRRSG